ASPPSRARISALEKQAGQQAQTLDADFWDSIVKASANPAEYQAYLEQFPDGRFASLARARINALKIAAAKPAPVAAPPPPATAPQPPAQVAAVAPAPVASGRAPVVGERWTYRYTDHWKPGAAVQVTHTVTAVHDGEIVERLSAVVGGRTLSAEASMAKGAEIREWNLGELAFREFAPFALAFDALRPGRGIGEFHSDILQETGRVDWLVKTRISGEEEVTVPAGRFLATKVVLEGASSQLMRGMTSFRLTVWYAPQSKRYVKATFASYARMQSASNGLHHDEVYELVSAPR
ncbi:MAG: hypothetical protein ACT4P3_17495, partial [Betaproteobacteria bacterium]